MKRQTDFKTVIDLITDKKLKESRRNEADAFQENFSDLDLQNLSTFLKDKPSAPKDILATSQ